MKPFLVTLMSILFLYSCTNKETAHKSNAKFPAKKELKAVKHFTDEILYPEFMTITGNILSIGSSKSDSMLFHFSLPKMELIENTGIKGNAADEFSLFPMFWATQIFHYKTPFINVSKSGLNGYTLQFYLLRYSYCNMTI
ncbi:MAG: hypothetical protein PHI32_01120 [Dysgonamonadaceae bacterium]|nr:hypothetical protein [Dysgonamonadaceae bacterium]MDD4727521.1 hypothetical protein [Dysgonamonadaceae bacterium]